MSSPTAPQILLSIKPRHAVNIVKGLKTVEFRRRFPSESRVRGSVIWFYSTAPVKLVTCRAFVVSVTRMAPPMLWSAHGANGAVDRASFDDYFLGVQEGFAIALCGVRRLTRGVGADEFRKLSFKVPQSYRYIPEPVLDLLNDCLGAST